jgi:hypothetical protein
MINRTRRPVALLLLASGLLAGCEASAPSTPSPPPPAGTVGLTTSRPDGAALVVNPCTSKEGDTSPCTRDLQMTFSVVLNRDVDRAGVWTEFYTTTGHLCAAANTSLLSLTAGTAATLTATSVYLSLQGSSTSPECGLPVETTRMVAHLWAEGVSTGDLLRQEFSKAYNFTNP